MFISTSMNFYHTHIKLLQKLRPIITPTNHYFYEKKVESLEKTALLDLNFSLALTRTQRLFDIRTRAIIAELVNAGQRHNIDLAALNLHCLIVPTRSENVFKIL